MVLHSELTDTKVFRGTSAPTDPPSFVGEVFVEDNSDGDVGRCLRVATATDSAADFAVVAFIPQAYAGDPNGNVVSRCVRDLCINTSANALYYASSAGSTSWTALSSGGGGGGS